MNDDSQELWKRTKTENWLMVSWTDSGIDAVSGYLISTALLRGKLTSLVTTRLLVGLFGWPLVTGPSFFTPPPLSLPAASAQTAAWEEKHCKKSSRAATAQVQRNPTYPPPPIQKPPDLSLAVRFPAMSAAQLLNPKAESRVR